MEKNSHKKNQTIESEILNNRWSKLYKFGGIASFFIAILLLGEIFVYAIIPDRSTPSEIFALFHDNSLVGLLFFDLLGMISYLLYIPLIISFYMTLRRFNESIMAVAILGDGWYEWLKTEPHLNMNFVFNI